MLNLKAAFALINKLKAIYEKNDQFLALSLGLSIDKNDFELIAAVNPPDERAADQARYNFAKIVNAVPEKSAAYHTTDQMLWDEFLDVLDPAQVEIAADIVLPPALKTRFEEAKLLVYQDYETRTESEKRVNYRGFKQVYETLERQILTGDYDAQTGSIDQNKWTNLDRPELLKKKDEVFADWKSKGFKEAIETALQVIDSVESQAPLSTWSKWKSKTVGSPVFTAIEDGSKYFLTTFSPGDFANNQGCWNKFILTNQAIEAAGQSAPAEIMNLLSIVSDQSDLEIESISFEVAVVDIYRPWLSEEAFQSGIWRFNQQNRLLSDGAAKPKGELPAYPVKMILAKNPVIKLKPGSTVNLSWLELLKNRPLWLGPLKLNRIKVELSPKTITTLDHQVQVLQHDKGLSNMVKVSPSALNMNRVPPATKTKTSVSDVQIQKLNLKVIPANDTTLKNTQVKTNQATQVNWSSLLLTTNWSQINIGSTVGTTVKPQTNTPLNTGNVLAGNVVASSVLTANTSSSSSVLTANTTNWNSSVLTSGLGGFRKGGEAEEEYQILGFICKVLPKSPNPSASLVWNSRKP